MRNLLDVTKRTNDVRIPCNGGAFGKGAENIQALGDWADVE